MKTVAEMTEQEKARVRQCIAAWQRAGPELERMRRDDIRRADTAASIPTFDGLFENAVLNYPSKPTSGLVEQQRCFHRAKR
jgi:hypothetical protein